MTRERLLITLLAVAIGVLTQAMPAAADPVSATGTITKVTVYRGQALVSRSIEADMPADTSELIVGSLPPNIIPESIYAQTSGGVKVLSVRYRERAVREDTREEVKKLDAQIDEVKHKIKYATEKLEHSKAQWKMFESLKDFTITAEKSDLNRGLLVYDPLQSLTGLVEDKGRIYLDDRLKLDDEIAELKEELELLERKRNELTAGRSRTEREVLIFTSGGSGKKASIELSYLVTGANWNQQYNLRANPDDSKVMIEYNAVVNQTSGEDWNGVALSLSTAEPTMVSAAPVLDPMLVGLSSRNVQQVAQIAQPPMQQQAEQIKLYQKRRENIKQGMAANTELNQFAIDNQAFFLNVSQREAQEFQQQMAEISRIEGVSVTYDLPGRLTLPSRSDQQLVSIASISARAEFTLLATPLLTDYVYLQADVTNESDTILLPGQTSMFRNGEFVGKSQVPLVTIGERFTAGFGIDSQVQVAHELEDKTTRIQGGNRIDTYFYRIALENYKSTAVDLRLLDRLPYTKDSSIKIELDKTEPQLSTDQEYLRSLRKKGILRWDLKLPANTIGDKGTIVKYSYTMEYDRNMLIQPQRNSAQ